MTERFYSPPEDYRVEFSAKSYDNHVCISFYSAVILICFLKRRSDLKLSFCTSWSIAGVECLLLIQGLFESKIWKTFERRDRIQTKQNLTASFLELCYCLNSM